MPVTLRPEDLQKTLEAAYLLAIGDVELPALWLERARQLEESPSVAFIAAVGSVLLAKATDAKIDAFVIQAQEGSTGAFSLRSAATALGSQRGQLGYDIGSTSIRDPINHGTLVGSIRWDVALDRIRADHKPFFSLILIWLADINRLNQHEALLALAAYIRERRAVAQSGSAIHVKRVVDNAPRLIDLVEVVEGFVGADPEGGARGMALVAAAYRAAGWDSTLPSRNDPRPIDVRLSNGTRDVAVEVKQVDTQEPTADALVNDALKAGMDQAILAVLPPGRLVRFNVSGAIRRAEELGVVLAVTATARDLVHLALQAGTARTSEFTALFPRTFAGALREIRTAPSTWNTWDAIATRWQSDS
jgi:hypothetical protein